MKSLKTVEFNPPYGAEQNAYQIYPAIRKRIAGFFYSTQLYKTIIKKTKYENITNMQGTAYLKWLCLFFVVKSPYMTFYCSRAPPSNLESHKKFKIWRFHMIIKYDFLSKVDGEKPEVEVDESLAKLIEQMDADDFNLNRAETRRHIYMSQLEEKGCYIADDSDPLDDILKDELHEALMAAIEKLKPQQKELLRRIYEKGETQEEISKSEGVSQQAIASRLKTIYKFLKKFLK